MTQTQHKWLTAKTITGYEERAFLEYPFPPGDTSYLRDAKCNVTAKRSLD